MTNEQLNTKLAKLPEVVWVHADMTAWRQCSEDDTRYVRGDLFDSITGELIEIAKAAQADCRRLIAMYESLKCDSTDESDDSPDTPA